MLEGAKYNIGLQTCKCYAACQEAVERREAEIVRLGAEAGAGRDLDVTALQYRSEAQENLILQLNDQVPFCLPHACTCTI